MRIKLNPAAGLLVGVIALQACSPAEQATQETTAAADPQPAAAAQAPQIDSNPLRNAYFGDTHIHTVLSFDAYLMGTRQTPDDAYEFAKGAAIEHASGFSMQMKKPLDFLAVSDHGFYLGMMREVARGTGDYSSHSLRDAILGATSAEGSTAAFQAALGHLQTAAAEGHDDLDDRNVARSAWQEIIDAAERHNDPGNFTTFVAYEFTSGGPEFQNLHRNVIFSGDQVPAQPFTRLDSLDPEDLWDWMDTYRNSGQGDVLAIPHNSNGSDGWMFSLNKFMSDEPLDAAYAEQRMRNEPIVENTQVKGTSDTHPLLSPNDEWADFEIMPIRVASTLTSKPPGSYVREAWRNGLELQESEGFNPFKFGVIGASDTHNAAGSFEEDNYWSKTGLMDIEPHLRGSIPLPGTAEDPKYAQGAPQFWGASGLAGVWAESNTRDAIYDGLRRKETFATSGPHIKVRFFGSFDFQENLGEAEEPVAVAYANGVTMGSDLNRVETTTAPSFYVWATQDPDTEPLQRIQIIKGWLEEGESREVVIDVACSDGLQPDPQTNRCPDNGAKVDLATCATTRDKGDPEMSVVWQDPDFDPEQRAFYYVRVLENPTCRWSTWDAVRAGVEPNPTMHATIQDRAWSSPIWYEP